MVSQTTWKRLKNRLEAVRVMNSFLLTLSRKSLNTYSIIVLVKLSIDIDECSS